MHGVLREPRKNPGQEDEKMHIIKKTVHACTKFVSSFVLKFFLPRLEEMVLGTRLATGYPISHELMKE